MIRSRILSSENADGDVILDQKQAKEDAHCNPRIPLSRIDPNTLQNAAILPLKTDGNQFVTSLSNSVAPSELQTRENQAWLDMLLALFERRYGNNSLVPVPIRNKEPARPLKESTYAILEQKDTTNVISEKEKTKLQRIQTQAQQVQATSVDSLQNCGCKTGCLKMYCVCFSSRGFCHPKCNCEACNNTKSHKRQRLEAIETYLVNDPRAFSFAPKSTLHTAQAFYQLLPQKSNAVVLRGCRCKKSKCLKKYCECFQNGIPCTLHCRCLECANKHSNHEISPARIQSMEKSAFPLVRVSVSKNVRKNKVRKSLRIYL